MKNFKNGYPLFVFMDDVYKKINLLKEVREELKNNNSFDYNEKYFKRTSKNIKGFGGVGYFKKCIKSEAFELIMDFLNTKNQTEKERFIKSLKIYFNI